MTDSPTRRSLWKEILAGALLCALVLGVALAAAPPDAFAGHGRHDWGSDPERAQKHARFMTGFVLDEVDATPEQTEQVTAIVLAFVQEAQALRELHQERRELLLAELSRPEISRESIQTLRAQELASIDALSQKLADAVVDAASILTPEQRARLVEYAEEMHGRHGH